MAKKISIYTTNKKRLYGEVTFYRDDMDFKVTENSIILDTKHKKVDFNFSFRSDGNLTEAEVDLGLKEFRKNR